MTSIDTIELVTNTDFIKSMDSNCFNVSQISKPNELLITNYSLNNKHLGVNKVNINDTYNTLTINASSKILGANYMQGICNNTLAQFIYELNNTGIELDQDFIYNSIIKKVDVKNDLKLTNYPDDYINTLNQLTAPKFTKTKYDTGIVFNEKIKSQPIRLTGYTKEYEIQQNKPFYNTYPELIKSFSNVLRIESRLPNKATVKKYFKSNDLIDILNTELINYQILNKIIDSQINFKPLLCLSKMSNTVEKNIGQIYMLNDYYNGDFDSIYNHIKSKYGIKTKVTGLRQKVKKSLAIINNTNGNYSLENIEEIKAKLKE